METKLKKLVQQSLLAVSSDCDLKGSAFIGHFECDRFVLRLEDFDLSICTTETPHWQYSAELDIAIMPRDRDEIYHVIPNDKMKFFANAAINSIKLIFITEQGNGIISKLLTSCRLTQIEIFFDDKKMLSIGYFSLDERGNWYFCYNGDIALNLNRSVLQFDGLPENMRFKVKLIK